MSDKKLSENMLKSYEKMVSHVHDWLENSEQKAGPALSQALQDAREKLVTLGELTREEADRLSIYIERDMHDAANYIEETGEEFKDWLRFDWQLIEQRMLDMLIKVADQTSVQLADLAEQAKKQQLYLAGELTGPGTLTCAVCGESQQFYQAGEIKACEKCGGKAFQRQQHQEAE